MSSYKVDKEKGTFTVKNHKGEDEEHPIVQGFVNYHLQKPPESREEVQHKNKVRDIRTALGGKSYDS